MGRRTEHEASPLVTVRPERVSWIPKGRNGRRKGSRAPAVTPIRSNSLNPVSFAFGIVSPYSSQNTLRFLTSDGRLSTNEIYSYPPAVIALVIRHERTAEA